MTNLKANLRVTLIYLNVVLSVALALVILISIFTLHDISKTWFSLNSLFVKHKEAKIGILYTGLYVSLILDAAIYFHRSFKTPSKNLTNMMNVPEEAEPFITNKEPNNEDSHDTNQQ